MNNPVVTCTILLHAPLTPGGTMSLSILDGLEPCVKEVGT
jgi:hypothetical protein